jgi:hypothetical protein
MIAPLRHLGIIAWNNPYNSGPQFLEFWAALAVILAVVFTLYRLPPWEKR